MYPPLLPCLSWAYHASPLNHHLQQVRILHRSGRSVLTLSRPRRPRGRPCRPRPQTAETRLHAQARPLAPTRNPCVRVGKHGRWLCGETAQRRTESTPRNGAEGGQARGGRGGQHRWRELVFALKASIPSSSAALLILFKNLANTQYIPIGARPWETCPGIDVTTGSKHHKQYDSRYLVRSDLLRRRKSKWHTRGERWGGG